MAVTGMANSPLAEVADAAFVAVPPRIGRLHALYASATQIYLVDLFQLSVVEQDPARAELHSQSSRSLITRNR